LVSLGVGDEHVVNRSGHRSSKFRCVQLSISVQKRKFRLNNYAPLEHQTWQ
jgi:hypothetical protein